MPLHLLRPFDVKNVSQIRPLVVQTYYHKTDHEIPNSEMLIIKLIMFLRGCRAMKYS